MSQGSLIVPNGSGSAVRTAINAALDALGSLNSGATAPSTTIAHMLWSDTTTGKLKMRNSTNTAWVELGVVDSLLGVPQDSAIINGAVDVWQRGTSFATAADGQYSADRWKYTKVGAVVHTLSRSTDVPTVAQAGVLFNYSLRALVTTPDTTIASTDVCYLSTHLEGYDFRNYAQRPFVVGFWVKSAITGVMCVAFNNSGLDRSYIGEVTINAGNTWEYKTVLVPASVATGTWDYVNGMGLKVSFVLSAGANFQGTGAAWTTQTGRYATVNQVNLTNTSGDFLITGVKLELGSIATKMYPRTFERELFLAQRYYEKTFAYGTAPAQGVGSKSDGILLGHASGTSVFIRWVYKTKKRAVPTITTYNPVSANADLRDYANTVDVTRTIDIQGETEALLKNNAAATDQIAYQVHAAADAEF